MAKKAKLGNKLVCESCGTKFYDLGKTEPVCPRCGWSAVSGQTSEISEFDDEDALRGGDDIEASEDNFDEDFDKAAEAEAFSGNDYDDDDETVDDDELVGTGTDQIIEDEDEDEDSYI